MATVYRLLDEILNVDLCGRENHIMFIFSFYFEFVF